MAVSSAGFSVFLSLSSVHRIRRSPRLILLVPTLLLGYGIGRIGCLLAGDGDYGHRRISPWAMAFPNGTVPTDERVHPTPIYETLISFTFFGILWSQRRKLEVNPGMLLGASLILLGVERFFVEFWRLTPRVLGWMTAGATFQHRRLHCRYYYHLLARSRPPVIAAAETVEATETSESRSNRHLPVNAVDGGNWLSAVG